MFADNPINFKTATDRILNHVRWFLHGGADADREVVAAGGIFEVLTGKEQYSFANKYPATAELLARIMKDFGHISGPHAGTAMEELLVYVEKNEVRPYLVKHTARMNPLTRKLQWSRTERQLWEGVKGDWRVVIRQTAPTGFAWELHGPPGALGGERIRGLDGTLAEAKASAEYVSEPFLNKSSSSNPEMTEVEDLLRDEWDGGLDAYDAEQMLVLHGFSKRDSKRFARTEWDKLPANVKREVWDSVAAGVPEEAYLAGAEMTYRLSAAANPGKTYYMKFRGGGFAVGSMLTRQMIDAGLFAWHDAYSKEGMMRGSYRDFMLAKKIVEDYPGGRIVEQGTVSGDDYKPSRLVSKPKVRSNPVEDDLSEEYEENPKHKEKGVSLPTEPEGITPEWAIWFECDDEGYPEEDCMPDPEHRDHDKWHKKHVAYIGKRAKVKVDDLLRRKDIGKSTFYDEFEKRLIDEGYDVWNSDSRFEVYLPGEVPEEERVERPVRRPSRKKPSGRGKLFEIEPDYIEDVWQYVDFDCISGQTPGVDCAPDPDVEGGEARKRWNVNSVTEIARDVGGEIERHLSNMVYSYTRDEFGESFLYERLADLLVKQGYGVYNSDTRFMVWKPGEIPAGE